MKPVSFSDMKRVRRMELNEFNRWVTSIYASGFGDGYEVGETWTDDEIFKLLRSERIGEEKANRIVNKLLRCEDD